MDFKSLSEAEQIKLLREAGFYAALATINVHELIPIEFTVHKHTGNNTSSQTLKTPRFDPDYNYIITSISAYNPDDAAHQIRLGASSGGENRVYNSDTVGNTGDSVDYVGQLMMKEGDQVFAEFRGVGANDNLFLFVNGYKIKK